MNIATDNYFNIKTSDFNGKADTIQLQTDDILYLLIIFHRFNVRENSPKTRIRIGLRQMKQNVKIKSISELFSIK